MKRKLQMVEGENYVTISRVECGWDVEASGTVAHVTVTMLPALQSKGLDEFVEGRSVAGMILDTSRTNGQTGANPLKRRGLVNRRFLLTDRTVRVILGGQ